MKRINLKKVLSLLAYVGIANFAIAQTTITFQPDGATGKDAEIDSHSGYFNSNFGYIEASEFGAATDGQAYLMWDLLQFDLTSIPAGSTVTSAYLTMYNRFGQPSSLTGNGGHYNPTDNAGVIEKITASWNENIVTWNNQPPTTAIGSINLPATGTDTASLYNLDVTAWVNNWVNNPSSNFGMMFKILNTNPYRNQKYYSSDAAIASVRPKLVIIVNCPVLVAAITPSSPVTFCAGGSVMLSETPIAGTYQWLRNNVAIAGATSSIYDATQGGTFKCVVTNVCGAIKTSNSVKLTKLTLAVPTITAAGPTSFCGGGSVTLNSSNPGAGYSVQWFKGNVSIPGATGLSYVAYSKGTYKILISNNSTGCSRLSAGIVVTVTACREGDNAQAMNETYVNEKMLVYPNPSKGTFMFDLSETDRATGNAEVTIMNTLGQQVFQSVETLDNGSLESPINLDGKLKNGIYFLNVTINGKIYQGKIMIQ